jgi:aryl-alcohol dehydrogenase-like predicted oxidoreductase
LINHQLKEHFYQYLTLVNLIKKMKTRKLGNTGIEVSEIAFGGVEIGIPYGIGVNSREDMLSREQAIELLHEALAKGINFFDTARLYGDSESIMGEAFHDKRKKVILSTKCKHFKDSEGNIPGYNALKNIIETSLEESLSYLRTDYVDIFMLHQADFQILNNDDVKQIFTELKASGKTRAIGASTYTSEETKTAIEKGWDVIQLPFNLMDQQQAQNFKYAEEKGVGVIVRSVLMKGLLSDKGRDLHPALEEVETHIKKYSTLLSQDITEISTLATKFALSFNEVSSVLVGIDRSEYLDKALFALSGKLLNQSDLSKAKDLAYPYPEFLDLPKWDRLGWLK